MKDSAQFFKSGAATFVHGVWLAPTGTNTCVDRPGCVLTVQDKVKFYDFLNLVAGETDTNYATSLKEPYPERFKLWKIKSAKLKLLGDIFEATMEARVAATDAYYSEFVGNLYFDKGGNLGFKSGNAESRSTLKRIYRIP